MLETNPPQPRTILVADDEERNRDLVRAILGSAHRTVEAHDGPSALEALTRHSVDLVLLDVMMPGMSGFEVCRHVKERKRDGFLPVLLLTSLSDKEDRYAGLEAGADDFLTKPIDRRELLLRVGTFLRLREQDAELRRQYQALQRLDELKEDLFSLLVHDMRNPLTGIMGYAELLRMKLPGGGSESRMSEAMLGSARQMSALLDEILHVRLLEEGQVPLDRQPTSLSQLLAEAVGTVSGSAASSGVRIAVQAAPDLAATLDPRLVRRCVENLLGNALKYSPRGSEVLVRAEAEESGLRIDVADQGPGIPDGLKEHMFQKFGSIEARKGQARRGFGLGLHLVQLVTAAHGGRATVGDREGGGSVFSLWFPSEAAQGATDAR